MKWALLFFSFCNILFAQESRDNTHLISFTEANIGVGGISIEYQTPLEREFVLQTGIGLQQGIKYNKETELSKSNHYPSVFISTELRYLYSYNKRIKLKRETKLNSSSYFGFKTSYQFQSFISESNGFGNVISISGLWGIQRNLDDNFLLDFNVGLGLAKDFNVSKYFIYPQLKAGITYVLTQ